MVGMNVKKRINSALKRRGIFVQAMPVLADAELAKTERYDPYDSARMRYPYGATAADGCGRRFKYLPTGEDTKRYDLRFFEGIGACVAATDAPKHHMCWYLMFTAGCDRAF